MPHQVFSLYTKLSPSLAASRRIVSDENLSAESFLFSFLNNLHAPLALFLASKGLGHYLHTHYGDRTFHGLYRWNAFDLAILIPYFIVMVILAFYGIHRYQLVWLYYHNKKKAALWDEPGGRYAAGELPFVTVQLPIFNEQFVIDRLIDAVCRLDYPRDRFEIQLLDDSTDETVEVAAGDRRALRARHRGTGAAAHRASASHQPAWIQGGRAGRGPEGRARRAGRHLRRRLCAPAGLADEGGRPLRRARHRHGADPLDAPQPQLQLHDPGGGHPAGRPLRAGARRPLALRRLLQLQRHRGRVAARRPSPTAADGSTTP